MNDFLWFDKQRCELFKPQTDLYKRGIVERLIQSFSDTEEKAKNERERLYDLPVLEPDIDPGETAEHIQDKVIEYYENLKETQGILFEFAIVGPYHL